MKRKFIRSKYELKVLITEFIKKYCDVEFELEYYSWKKTDKSNGCFGFIVLFKNENKNCYRISFDLGFAIEDYFKEGNLLRYLDFWDEMYYLIDYLETNDFVNENIVNYNYEFKEVIYG